MYILHNDYFGITICLSAGTVLFITTCFEAIYISESIFNINKTRPHRKQVDGNGTVLIYSIQRLTLPQCVARNCWHPGQIPYTGFGGWTPTVISILNVNEIMICKGFWDQIPVTGIVRLRKAVAVSGLRLSSYHYLLTCHAYSGQLNMIWIGVLEPGAGSCNDDGYLHFLKPFLPEYHTVNVLDSLKFLYLKIYFRKLKLVA